MPARLDRSQRPGFSSSARSIGGTTSASGLARVVLPETQAYGLDEEALLRIYTRLRPGNPPMLEKARTLFNEKFYDANRYRLGRVGRFRINRKLDLGVSEKEMTLRPDDMIAAIAYLIGAIASAVRPAACACGIVWRISRNESSNEFSSLSTSVIVPTTANSVSPVIRGTAATPPRCGLVDWSIH